MDVCAVVVTYNRRTMLEQCIASLCGQTTACDVLVINNASTDDTAAYLAGLSDPRICAVTLPENTGGAGGFNAGMRCAVEKGYRYVWIMDDDTLPEPDALDRLMQADALLHGDYGFLSSVALWTDGRECRMNRQKLKKAYYHHVELLRYGLIEAEQATFVSCFFRADTIVKAGLPIKEFFIWGDDIEYTRRLSVRMQKPCYVVGQSVVIHAMQSNTGSNIATDQVARIGRYRYAYRNESYLYRKEGISGIAYYLARCGLHLIRIWKDGRDHRLRRSGIILKQLIVGWRFHPAVEFVEKRAE